jgi:hypothetical protein
MNITLRCRGSKREQARPPICAAGRRAHRRAGCRGDQSNAALNARVRPNRQHSYRSADLDSGRPLPSRRRTTSSRHQRFFLSVVGELDFHYNAVERALLVERGRRGRVEAVRAVSPPGQYRSPCPQRRVRCCRTLARHRHWTSSRSRISAARSAHLASVSRPSNRVAPRNRPSLRHFESEPGSIPVGTLWRPERHGACPCCCFILPANTARLLVGISVGIGNNRRQKLV